MARNTKSGRAISAASRKQLELAIGHLEASIETIKLVLNSDTEEGRAAGMKKLNEMISRSWESTTEH